MTAGVKIAVAQIDCAVGDVAANTAKIRSFAQRAKAESADWVVFPEMADTGYEMSAIRQCATSWKEGAMPALRQIAVYNSLGVICGISERVGQCIYNTQAAIDAQGEIAARYRKTHLFAPIEEDVTCSAGSELICLEAGELRFGLGICYDIRFPEFYRTLTMKHDANVLVLSAAWPFPRLEHLRTLARARAIENQSYFALANRAGTDGALTFCGTSCVIDPYGEVIAEAPTDGEELLVAEVSIERIRAVRAAMPVLGDRRTEIYQ
jgi:predicted amidohydrolase